MLGFDFVSSVASFDPKRANLKIPHPWSALAIGLVCLSGTVAAKAQTAAPITVTPPSLAPPRTDNGFRVEIPEAGALIPPTGAEGVAVKLGTVEVVGGFSDVADQTAAIVAAIQGRSVTLAEIYAAASKIEAIHAHAGYVLARVTIPPQDLSDGAPLKIIVIDGFIEDIDVSQLPARVRHVVARRTESLVGKRHVKLSEIEQPLLLANETPGLTLRSTLMRGAQPGGTRLVLEGDQQLVTGAFGADNQLASSLETYGVNAQAALNSAFGRGETLYAFASSGYQVSRMFSSDAPVRVEGGGAILPIGDGRLTLNPEATFSRTLPTPVAGAPPTDGTLSRLTVRAAYRLVKTRTLDEALNFTLEQLDEKNIAIALQPISRDRYMVGRLGLNVSNIFGGVSVVASGQISQGLGDFGAITRSEAAASGIGFSRSGARLNFTKATAQLQFLTSLGQGFDATLSAKGQAVFGQSVFRSEQFTLEGSDGLSSYVGGATAVDQGYVLRAEISRRAIVGAGDHAASFGPYVFAAAGQGWVNAATSVEAGSITAESFGLGMRSNLYRNRLSFSVEYALGFSNVAGLNNSDRVNFTASVHF